MIKTLALVVLSIVFPYGSQIFNLDEQHTEDVQSLNLQVFPVSCSAPDSSLIKYEVWGNGVVFRWPKNIGSMATQILYDTAGFTPSTSSNQPLSGDSVAFLRNLPQNSLLDFYFRDSCAPGSYSSWVGPFTVSTACAPPAPMSLPWVEGFETSPVDTIIGSGSLCSSNYLINFDGWFPLKSRLIIRDDSLFANTGSKSISLDCLNSILPVHSSFLISTLNLSAYSNVSALTLSVSIMSHGQELRDNNRLWVRGSPLDPWIQAVNLDAIRSAQGVYDTISDLNIKALLNYNGQSLSDFTQIRIGQEGKSSIFFLTGTDGISIDDLKIDTSSCPYPLNTSSKVISDTSVKIAFTPGNHEIALVPKSSNIIISNLSGAIVSHSGDSIIIDTLSPSTCYVAFARSFCGQATYSTWSKIYEFCTPCSEINAPYFENWDNLPVGKNLGCFSALQDSSHIFQNGQGASITSSGSPFSGNRQLELDRVNIDLEPPILVSPRTSDLTTGLRKITFRAKKVSISSPEPQVYVGTMKSPYDKSSFHPLDTFSVRSGSNFKSFTTEFMAFNGYNGIDKYFAIMLENGRNRSVYIDDLSYDTILPCRPPINLRLVSFNYGKALIDYVPRTFFPGSSQFEIQWGTDTFNGALNNSLITNTDSIILSSLNSGSGYCVWIRELCSSGDTSAWSSPFCFIAPCGNVTSAPYYQNFETAEKGSAPSGQWRNCWTNQKTSGNLSWHVQKSTGNNLNSPNTGPLYDHSLYPLTGGKYTYLETSLNGGPAVLSSPFIDLSGLSQPNLKFYYHSYGASVNKVIISAEDTSGNTFILDSIVDDFQLSQSDPYALKSIPLGSLPIGIYKFKIAGYKFDFTYGYHGDIAIDDFSIDNGPWCKQPDKLKVNYKPSNSVEVSWPSDTSVTAWQYEFDTTGFTIGSGTRGVVSTNLIKLNNLSHNKEHQIYVRAICSNQDTSNWSAPLWFKSCSDFSAPYSEDFESINLQALSSGFPIEFESCWKVSSGSNRLINWFAAESQSGQDLNTLYTGPLYDATKYPASGGKYLFLETSNNEVGPSILYSPFINLASVKNPTLTYAYHMFGFHIQKLELIAIDSSSNTYPLDSLIGQQQAFLGDSFYRRTITLDSILPPGIYKFAFKGFGTGNFSQNRGDIAIDDFSINGDTTCSEPKTLSADSVTNSSAYLYWVSNFNAKSWQIKYDTSGFNLAQGNLINVSQNSHEISGLNNSTSYDYYVREICLLNDTSNWVGPFTFKTLCLLKSSPYIEDFENISIGTPPGFPPGWENCWTQKPGDNKLYWKSERSIGSSSNTPTTGPAFDKTLFPASGGVYIYLETDSISTEPAELISPTIDFGGISYPTLSFGYHMYGFNINKLVIAFKDSLGNITMLDSIMGQQQTSSSDSFYTKHLDLRSAPSTIGQFIFIGYRGNGSLGDIALDDIRIGTLNPCSPPRAPYQSFINYSQASFYLSNGVSPTGHSWEVEFDTAGFSLGNGNRFFYSNPSINLNALKSNTEYELYVRKICGTGDTSFWKGPHAFKTLCSPIHAPYQMYFENMPIGKADSISRSWNNCWTDLSVDSVHNWRSEEATGANENTPNTGPLHDGTFHPIAGGTYMYMESDNYTNFGTSLRSPYINLDSLANPVLKYKYHMHGADMGVLFVYAIDTAGNKTELDSIFGEQHFNQSDNFTEKTVDLSSLGSIMQFEFRGLGFQGNKGDMAIDDVLIVDSNSLSSCTPPQAFTSTLEGCDSIVLLWQSGSGSSYLEFGTQGFVRGTGSTVNSAKSPLLLKGLSPGIKYDFYVSDSCSSADTSDYSFLSKTTASLPLPIGMFNYTFGTVNGQQAIFLDASASRNATGYNWTYGSSKGSGRLDTVIVTSSGIYTIKLITTNSCGSDTVTQLITFNIDVEEYEFIGELKVYPNPVHEELTIELQKSSGKDIKIWIKDSKGSIVYSKQSPLSNEDFRCDIDMSKYAAGLYIGEIETDGLRRRVKIIKR